MKRSQRYPETSTFTYYNANPKGKITGDCLYRAVATALEKPWEEVVMDLAKKACETGYSAGSVENMDKYLKDYGFVKQKQPRKPDNTKYTGKEFCDYLSINYKDGEIGNLICNIGGHHVVAIKPTEHGDGFNCRYKVFDIWDSTYKCIGNYWVKKG